MYLIRRVGWQVPKRQRFGEAILPHPKEGQTDSAFSG